MQPPALEFKSNTNIQFYNSLIDISMNEPNATPNVVTHRYNSQRGSLSQRQTLDQKRTQSSTGTYYPIKPTLNNVQISIPHIHQKRLSQDL